MTLLTTIRSLTIKVLEDDMGQLEGAFHCPNLEKLTFVGSNTTATTARLPYAPNLVALDLGGDKVNLLKLDFYHTDMFYHLRSLRCIEELAASFYPDLTPNLSVLALAPSSRPKKFQNSHFIRAIVASKTLSSIEFNGRYWVQGSSRDLDINIFLHGKIEFIERRWGLLDTPQSLSVSSAAYPDWPILLRAIKLGYSCPYGSRIQTLRLPALPHARFLYPLVRVLKGDLSQSISLPT